MECGGIRFAVNFAFREIGSGLFQVYNERDGVFPERDKYREIAVESAKGQSEHFGTPQIPETQHVVPTH